MGLKTPHSPFKIISMAFSWENAFLYTRSLTRASYTSAIATTWAAIGISSPFNPSGYPFPSYRSWCHRQIWYATCTSFSFRNISRLSNIEAPISVWVFMISNSSFVSFPGLFNIFSSIPIFPISWSAEAVVIMKRSDHSRWYWSVFCIRRSSSMPVIVLICNTWLPLSPFLNSTIWLKMLTIIRLCFSFSWIWSVTRLIRCLCFA